MRPMATAEGGSGGEKGQGGETSVTYYRLEEVAKRNSLKELWLVIHGRVYDVTRFLNEVGALGVGVPVSCRDEGERLRAACTGQQEVPAEGGEAGRGSQTLGGKGLGLARISGQPEILFPYS